MLSSSQLESRTNIFVVENKCRPGMTPPQLDMECGSGYGDGWDTNKQIICQLSCQLLRQSHESGWTHQLLHIWKYLLESNRNLESKTLTSQQ